MKSDGNCFIGCKSPVSLETATYISVFSMKINFGHQSCLTMGCDKFDSMTSMEPLAE